MQEGELLQEGLALMGMGMGFVFVFLAILVVSVTLMSVVVRRFQPPPEPAAKRTPATRVSEGSESDEEVLAVISAAVHRYRTSRTR